MGQPWRTIDLHMHASIGTPDMSKNTQGNPHWVKLGNLMVILIWWFCGCLQHHQT